MAYSRINYVGNGSQTQFAINFPLGLLTRSDVTCYVIGEVDGLGNQVYRTLTWINDGLVQVSGTAPAVGATVVFERTIDKDTLVHDYSDGSSIIEENLDQSNKQNIMLVHEVLDGRFGTLQNDIDLGQFTVKNIADPVDPQDAVNLRYFEANNALANRQAAEAAQVAAEQAEANAVAAKAAADADAASALSSKNTAAAAAASATVDAASTAADRAAVAADKGTVASDKATVTTLAAQVSSNASQVASDKATVAANTATVVADAAQVTADKEATHADRLAADTAAASAAASAASISLPSPAGNGTKYIRQKVDETGFEYRTPEQTRFDIGAFADIPGAIRGDILYYGAAGWTRLPKGSQGQVLLQGANDPTWVNPVFSAAYDSGDQVITSAGSLSLSHALGAKPKIITVVLKCVTAEGGYSVGDEVVIHSGATQSDSTAVRGVSLTLSTTVIGVVFGSGSPAFMIHNKATGATLGATNSNWRLVVRAYA